MLKAFLVLYDVHAQGISEELHSDIPVVTVWRMLRKLLHVKVYKLSIVEHLERRKTMLCNTQIHPKTRDASVSESGSGPVKEGSSF
jgi:hypothetical protein